ncbi:MAG: hypothetical protein CMA72_07490 [Euryarchaeota archaeon]|nr:hypothetical protein [Euryarchaeota archaeon]|tara:strand:+ start:3175 stop:3408 length:234 start_codon:yes stop_codon:yes gene_type:complete
MRHRIPPRLTPPKIGDLVRLSGPGGLGRAFKRAHGVGLVVSIVKPSERRIRYQVRWLKTDENMDFHEEDLIVVSNVG